MKKILGVLFCLAAVLLMVSTATAVPTKNAEPMLELVEQQEHYEKMIEKVRLLLGPGLAKQEKYDAVAESLSRITNKMSDSLFIFLILMYFASFYVLDIISFLFIPALFVLMHSVTLLYYFLHSYYSLEYLNPDMPKAELIIQSLITGIKDSFVLGPALLGIFLGGIIYGDMEFINYFIYLIVITLFPGIEDSTVAKVTV